MSPQLSLDDCYKIITSKLQTKQLKIVKYQQLRLQELNGYLGVHFTLKIVIERNCREEVFTFFVKFPPQVASQRNFLEEINGVFKEKSFFMKYCPLLKQHGIDILDETLPACYHVADGVFVFEDLTTKGYSTLPSRTPLEIAHVKAALSAFAKLHASGLILEETKSSRLIDDFRVELKEGFYLDADSTGRALRACKRGLGALIDITHQDDMKISRDLFKARAFEGIDSQKVFAAPSTKFRNTICHADPWTKNFLFRKQGEDINCAIVDFQTYRYGPPAQDVLAFIHLATDGELRRRHLGELLEFYYEELRRSLDKYGFKDAVAKEEFFESCVYYRQFALTQALTHFQVVILSDEIGKELFGDDEYAGYVLFEDRYDFVKMVCGRDEVFRVRNFEAIAELREFYEGKL